MVLEQFFKDIMARTTIGTGIKHFAWYNDQGLNEENEDPIPTPAVLIEITDSTPRSVGRRVQYLDLQFRLYLLTELYTELDSREPTAILNAGLGHLVTIDEITERLHGWPAAEVQGADARALLYHDADAFDQCLREVRETARLSAQMDVLAARENRVALALIAGFGWLGKGQPATTSPIVSQAPAGLPSAPCSNTT